VINQEFKYVYDLFRESFYESLCSKELSLPEAFSIDVIELLQEPTILEYANYMHISQSNATYKINQLIAKGYVERVESKTDKRSAHLKVTPKAKRLYRKNDEYIESVMNHIRNSYTYEQVLLLETMLKEIAKEMEREKDHGKTHC
jgi:DNA-binding MarR family transcriptional regulator